MGYKFMTVIYKCDLCHMSVPDFPMATMYSEEGKHHICKNCFKDVMKLKRNEMK